jgi:hypothetical protein
MGPASTLAPAESASSPAIAPQPTPARRGAPFAPLLLRWTNRLPALRTPLLYCPLSDAIRAFPYGIAPPKCRG